MTSLAERFKKQDDEMLKNPAIASLDYYKIFNYRERVAARCGAEIRCHLCDNIIFYTDILNLEEGISYRMICESCRNIYNKSFQAKKADLRSRGKQL